MFGDMAVLGYGDKISAEPDETIKFMVSCEATHFTADIVRILCGDINPMGPGFGEEMIKTPLSGRYRGQGQTINCGSYAVIPLVRPIDISAGLTVQAMIWPTTPNKGEQVLISSWRTQDSAGFQLIIDAGGELALKLGDGSGRVETISSGKPLLERMWYFAGATFDAKSRMATVHQEPLIRYALLDAMAIVTRRLPVGALGKLSAAIVLAAAAAPRSSGRRQPTLHYNGKMDSPRLASCALTRAEMAQLLQLVVPTQLRNVTLAAWDFSRDIDGVAVTDVSGNGLHGSIFNLPTRAMTGWNWTGEEANWRNAPGQYGAIHFHDDDIYDASWQPSLELKIPASLKSGCYAVRLRVGDDEDYIPFFVRPPRGKPRAKILYVAPTATYMAYGNVSFEFTADFVEAAANKLIVVQPWEEYLNLHPELGGSLYDLHSDGSGICYSSRLRPILNMRPKVMHSFAGAQSCVLHYNADTHLIRWLDQMGHAFDVITDEDLHAEGIERLRDYNVVLTGTHPEYYTTHMLDAMKAYTECGGRLMYMGGNGFYWRHAYHTSLPGVMEVRRTDESTRTWKAKAGEYYHAFGGELGGTWRNLGRPPQILVGSGSIALGWDVSSYYRRTKESFDARASFIFEGIAEDAIIGDHGLSGNGAAGFEIDIADHALGTPPHSLVVAASERHTDAYTLFNEDHPNSMANIMGSANERIRSELLFHETPNGGGVFAFSSIAWGGSLSDISYDNNVCRLTTNVLRHFARDGPLPQPRGNTNMSARNPIGGRQAS